MAQEVFSKFQKFFSNTPTDVTKETKLVSATMYTNAVGLLQILMEFHAQIQGISVRDYINKSSIRNGTLPLLFR